MLCTAIYLVADNMPVRFSVFTMRGHHEMTLRTAHHDVSRYYGPMSQYNTDLVDTKRYPPDTDSR